MSNKYGKLKLLSTLILLVAWISTASGGANWHRVEAASTISFNLQTPQPALNPQVGTRFPVSIYATGPTNTELTTVSVFLQYNPTQIKVINIQKGTLPPFDIWQWMRAQDVSNQNRVELIAGDFPLPGSTSARVLQDNLVATVTFEWVSTQPAQLTVLTGNGTSGAIDASANLIPAVPNALIIPASSALPPQDTPTPLPLSPTQECDSCGKCVGKTEIPPDYDECMTCQGQLDKKWTVFGCVDASEGGFVQNLLQIILGIAGGVSFLALLYGGAILLGSKGNSEQIQQGKSILIGAVSGLILVLFSIFILQFLGITIFNLPGFTRP